LLKTGRTVRIRTGCTTTSLVTEIKEIVAMFFEAYFGEFSVGGPLYMSEGTSSFCGKKYRGADFNKVVQLYEFGTFF
jgi:hypothetical protein